MKVRQLLINESIPYDLLLLADPSEEMIMTYINLNYIYIAELDGLTIGVLVLYPISEEVIEIKNIAIDENYQNRGIGTLLLLYADKIARDLGFDKLIVGTADVSFYQLKFYKKNGFVIHDIKKNFFTDNYFEPIFDNGRQCVDMIVLEKSL